MWVFSGVLIDGEGGVLGGGFVVGNNEVDVERTGREKVNC